jgi:hypothetical protein
MEFPREDMAVLEYHREIMGSDLEAMVMEVSVVEPVLVELLGVRCS